ncbi:MAG: bifunctional fucokinase/fucose-1-phosphate guanylyltransferase [Bacteroidales bacterium]
MYIRKLISLPEGMVPLFHEYEQKDREEWFCGSDPGDRKVGSGGGTAHLLAEAYHRSGFRGSFDRWLVSEKRLVIHAAGESRRLPAYAAVGKSLLPVPVFRWSKGQYLDQKLLDFQAPYYERILKNAPDSFCILIASGDVMFISTDRFRNLPGADVLVFGVWVDDTVASHHGVFFSKREKQDELAFVKQKPSLRELRELSHEYFYLMDSGIVLMNASAAMTLMKRAGWDREKGTFRGGIAGYYDLYGEMLAAFGTESGEKNRELRGMEVKLVPLHEGEFYHFGSNSDLIESNLKLQNRITDQRLKLTREPDHHPSIFQQNAQISMRFTDKNHHIWIENCFIPASWKLSHHHVLTGLPENEWDINLPERICVDVVPLGRQRFVLRPYGFSDHFRGLSEEGTLWMEKPLHIWLEEHRITPEEAGLSFRASLFDIPLFPVTGKDRMKEMLEFMVGNGTGPSGGFMEKTRDRWIRSERFSAGEIAAKADLASLYRQRRSLKSIFLPKLAENYRTSIFYYLDLERTAEDYRKSSLELPAGLSPDEPVIRRINDSMFRARVLKDRKEAEKYERRAFAILREAMTGTLKQDPVAPRRNLLDDQILWGRSPVRFDLAGGWTDTPPYCIMEGGKVVNMAVELNGQLPLQVFARPLEEPVIILRSIDLGIKKEIRTFEELNGFNRPGDGFSIPMAALVLAGFSNLFSEKQYPELAGRLKDFGCGIEMSLLAAIPKGSGLGTSSNLAATVLGTLSGFCGLGWDKHEISYRTLILEQMLTTGGGWQDQYGGVFEGIKLLETVPGIRQSPVIKWLPEQIFSRRETREMILLYYTGVTRVARDILGEIVKSMFLNSSRHLEIFHEMKQHARETFDVLLGNDYEGVAEKVALSWELNQRLDEGTNPPVIRDILRRVDDYLLGYKLLGAGGGGYLIMFAKSVEAAVRVKHELESAPPNRRARFVDFTISRSGFQVSRS